MGIKLHSILVAFLLLTVGFSYAGAQKQTSGSFLSVGHANNGSDYQSSSFDSNREIELSLVQSLRAGSQQVIIKKLTASCPVENIPNASATQNSSFSCLLVNSSKRSGHLLLIFPFHYFW
jgi:hypothetical protein